MSSHVAKSIARYSALALDLATTSCFLLFQDIRLPPINTQYLEVERLSEVAGKSMTSRHALARGSCRRWKVTLVEVREGLVVIGVSNS